MRTCCLNRDIDEARLGFHMVRQFSDCGAWTSPLPQGPELGWAGEQAAVPQTPTPAAQLPSGANLGVPSKVQL